MPFFWGERKISQMVPILNPIIAPSTISLYSLFAWIIGPLYTLAFWSYAALVGHFLFSPGMAQNAKIQESLRAMLPRRF